MKKIITTPLGIIFLIFLTSFTLKPNHHIFFLTGDNPNPAMAYDPSLYPLYIENTLANPRFEKLINRIFKTDVGNKNKNIVLQFFHQRDGILTLSVYVGRRNRQDWDDVNEFKLQPYTECTSIPPSIDKKAVFLGDLEIDSLDAKIDFIRAQAADHVNNQFIFFVPQFVQYGTTHKSVIQYTVFMLPNLTDVCDQDKLHGLVLSGASFQTNPSPPKNGN